MNDKDNINHNLLIDGSEHLQKRLRDPKFKAAYEAEQLRSDVAKIFKERRKNLNLTQTELAKKAHTDQKVISRIENGITSVGMDSLQKVAHALGSRVSISLL